MKILFILDNYLPHIGGVEIVFKNLCERLVKRGHDVTVLTRLLPGTKRKEARNGVRIIRVPSRDSRYLFTFAAIPQAIRLARHADVIHTTTYNSAFPAWLAALLRRKPAIMTVHETWLGRWREYSNFSTIAAFAHEFLELLVYYLPRFDRYVCVSDSTKKNLARVFPKRKIVTIHNGFEPGMWKRPREKNVARIRKDLGLQHRYVIFAAGRPGATKGFEYLIRAFPKIKERIENAILLLMLSEDRQYRHKIEEFKQMRHPDVYFIKPQPYRELPAWRQMADCIVVPSTSEGFGYAVLESVATGTPVVANNTTSIPEVIWGKHVLVAPKEPDAIADGVLTAFRGKYHVVKEKKFPWSRTVSAYEKVYGELHE